MTEIRLERPSDGPQIEDLLDLTFEPGRHARPSYRLREGVARLGPLCFVASLGGTLVGTIRFWPVRADDSQPAVLLGPIAVDPRHEGRGIGGRLIGCGLDAVRAAGHRIVFAVGDQGYLGRFGFVPVTAAGLTLAAQVPTDRLLVRVLAQGASAAPPDMVGAVTAPLPMHR